MQLQWLDFYHEQWGVALVSVIYTFSWAYGVYEWYWRSPVAEVAVDDPTE